MTRTPRIAAVGLGEPAVLGGGEPGPHTIKGVGIDHTPPFRELSLMVDLAAVPRSDTKAMTRCWVREEGLFAGTSSGATVLAAIEIGRRLGWKAKVVTFMCESGLQYLCTDVQMPGPG